MEKIISGNKVGIRCKGRNASVGALLSAASKFAKSNGGMIYACAGKDRLERARNTMIFCTQTNGYGTVWFEAA